MLSERIVSVIISLSNIYIVLMQYIVYACPKISLGKRFLKGRHHDHKGLKIRGEIAAFLSPPERGESPAEL